MRVGDRTDFNRLVFDIETDGSISPEDAFSRAVDILGKHVATIASPSSTSEGVLEEGSGE